MIRLALVCLLAFSQAAMAQQVSKGTGAVLRGLDKVDGDVTDIELANGEIQQIGRIRVHLRECRFPAGNPSGDAYAFLTIAEVDGDAPAFEGWMIASSPALNALEHPRYDVWVMRCKTP